eukprot:2687002-Prymnesium_polylepis.2
MHARTGMRARTWPCDTRDKVELRVPVTVNVELRGVGCPLLLPASRAVLSLDCRVQSCFVVLTRSRVPSIGGLRRIFCTTCQCRV